MLSIFLRPTKASMYLATSTNKPYPRLIPLSLKYLSVKKHKIIPLPRIIAGQKYQSILKKVSFMLIRKMEMETEMREEEIQNLSATFYSVKTHVKEYDHMLSSN